MRRFGIFASSVLKVIPTPLLRSFTTDDLSDPDLTDSPFTLSTPTHEEGDLLLAILSDGRSTGEGTFSPPSGWSNAFSFNWVDPFFGDAIQVVGFYKFAGPSEPATYSFTHNLFFVGGTAAIMSFANATGVEKSHYIGDFYDSIGNPTQSAPPATASTSDTIRVDIYSAMSFFEGDVSWDLPTYSGLYNNEFYVTCAKGGTQFLFDDSGSTSGTSMDFYSLGDAPGIAASFHILSSQTLPIVDIAVAHDLYPFITVYPWSNGFGAKYADPASPLPSRGYEADFTPSKDGIAIGHVGAPFVSAYSWSAGGFGTKYADPSPAPPNTCYTVSFSPSGNDIAVGVFNSPYIISYSWMNGFGPKYADPATLPSGPIWDTTFSPSGGAVLAAHSNAPYVSAYEWSNGFGAKYADPLSPLPGAGNGITFSPSGSDVIIAHSAFPYVTAYEWSNGFGTKYSNPATPLPGIGSDVFMHPSGNDIAISHYTTPYVAAYEWSSGFGAKYADPSDIFTNTARDIHFSPSGEAVAAVSRDAPHIITYPWYNGFVNKYADPAILPTGDSIGVKFQ